MKFHRDLTRLYRVCALSIPDAIANTVCRLYRDVQFQAFGISTKISARAYEISGIFV